MPLPALPVVLVHGAWHGAWSWSALQYELERSGVASYAVDLPGRSTSIEAPAGLAGDVRAVSAVLDRLATPVVLVGHSYGGAVVSGVAGQHRAVAAAVYVAAFALEAGESVNGFLRGAPRHPSRLADAMRPQPDGAVVLDPTAALDLLAWPGSDADAVAAQVARLSPQPAGTFTDPVDAHPFGRIPTTYVLCERDELVHPAHQEILAARCATTVRLAGGHFPMHEATDALTSIIADVARTAAAT